MPAWISELQRRLPSHVVVTDPEIIASYARDQASTATSGRAAALVRVRDTEQVATTLQVAHEHRIPVVTRAAGTGLTGGCNAIDGGIILSVAHLNRILKIDPVAALAVVEPGVINGQLATAAAAHNLFYAPDPASREISTIGGNIATNAGGACCLKYGVTGDHVLALKAVTAEGTAIHTGSLATKNVAGLDLTRLLVGSEGTLAVITEATVKLLRRRSAPATLVASFSTLFDAAAAILAMESTADLSLIEMMDQTTIGAVDRYTGMQLDTSAAAMVIVQSDARDAAQVIECCEALCQKHRATESVGSSDPEDGQMLLAARRSALPALEQLGMTLLDDVAVPKPALVEMFARCEQAAQRNHVVIGTFGHAGDGNLHPTIVFDDRDDASISAAQRAFDEIILAAMDLGGTISGEHGIGSLKQTYMNAMVGNVERALMRRIKAAFDPRGILNPGKGY